MDSTLTGRSRARLLVTQAREALAAGNRKDACARVTEAAQLAPDAAAVWLALASVSNDRAARLDALRRAFALAPDPGTGARLRHALLYQGVMIRHSNRAEARELFLEAATLDPGDPHIWQALIQLSETPSEAGQIVAEIGRLAPDDAGGRASLKGALAADACALQNAGQTEAACIRWRAVAAVDEGDAEAWLGVAETTSDKEEKKRAIAAASREPGKQRGKAAGAVRSDEPIDPAAFAPPTDAFARLAPPIDFDRFYPLADPFRDFELLPDPFARFTEEVQPANSETSDPARPTNPTPRRTIMVVHGSPTMRKVLGIALDRAGYKVIIEPDGVSAIERLARTVPDAIVLAAGLSRPDGYEVCRRIRKNPRTSIVPVLMLSDNDAFDAALGRAAGATCYLASGFDTAAILAAVSTACLPG